MASRKEEEAVKHDARLPLPTPSLFAEVDSRVKAKIPQMESTVDVKGFVDTVRFIGFPLTNIAQASSLLSSLGPMSVFRGALSGITAEFQTRSIAAEIVKRHEHQDHSEKPDFDKHRAQWEDRSRILVLRDLIKRGALEEAFGDQAEVVRKVLLENGRPYSQLGKESGVVELNDRVLKHVFDTVVPGNDTQTIRKLFQQHIDEDPGLRAAYATQNLLQVRSYAVRSMYKLIDRAVRIKLVDERASMRRTFRNEFTPRAAIALLPIAIATGTWPAYLIGTAVGLDGLHQSNEIENDTSKLRQDALLGLGREYSEIYSLTNAYMREQEGSLAQTIPQVR